MAETGKAWGRQELFGVAGSRRWKCTWRIPLKCPGCSSDNHAGGDRIHDLVRLLVLLPLFLGLGGFCAYGETAAGDASTYHTPLAGEAGEVLFMGQKVSLPGMDRSRMTSITLGASLMTPQQGETSLLPVGAFYHRRIAQEFRTRATISVFVNELEYDRDLGSVELVTHFENHTLPIQQSEVLNGAEVTGTSLYWGTLMASVGPGWRLPVHPFRVDNDMRLQLLARAGYFYADSGDDTAAALWVPTDTMLYGARLRGRYDGMLRNLLELPHQGSAAGWDLDYVLRDRWRAEDGGTGGQRDYLQVAGHLVGAAGVPGLSERDRLLYCLYGGHTMQKRGDRFNAFRINGASFPSEADDLPRPHYSGIIYDSALATSYATASAGYRRELTFFLYLTALYSYIWADRATVSAGEQVVFEGKDGAAATLALDSAFFWDSSLYLAYAFESGFIRNGRSGHGVTFMWNKLF